MRQRIGTIKFHDFTIRPLASVEVGGGVSLPPPTKTFDTGISVATRNFDRGISVNTNFV